MVFDSEGGDDLSRPGVGDDETVGIDLRSQSKKKDTETESIEPILTNLAHIRPP
jgi:hypothetical protein